MSMANFGMAVRIELIRRNMTPADLAEQMQVSASYVRKIINGKRHAPARREEIKTILMEDKSHEKSKKQEDGDCIDHQKRQEQALGRPRVVEQTREAV